VVPWRADPAVLAGYLRLNLLNGSFVNQYLPQQAYIIDFAGELPLSAGHSATACWSPVCAALSVRRCHPVEWLLL
jgi:hypothetical protein